MEFEAGPNGFLEGPYELSLLPNFSKHVACKLWGDKVVSIIVLFNLMICYLLFPYLMFMSHFFYLLFF